MIHKQVKGYNLIITTTRKEKNHLESLLPQTEPVLSGEGAIDVEAVHGALQEARWRAETAKHGVYRRLCDCVLAWTIYRGGTPPDTTP